LQHLIINYSVSCVSKAIHKCRKDHTKNYLLLYTFPQNSIVMKKLLQLSIIIFSSYCSAAQNVGIGTSTPSEKLDVNGNINIAGQMKVAGNAGTSNQVLMKDASNNMVWGDLSEFKNIQVFDCTNIAFNVGVSNCLNNWNVPEGVTTILVECWGGGGGGGTMTGGGGGGYISAKLTVTPLATANLIIGAGGNYGSTSVYGINGGNTSFAIASANILAYGGIGGSIGDPFISVSAGQALGGLFSTSGISNQFIGFNGNPGGISKLSFMVAGSADYAKIVNYGDGGDAALLPGSGSKGGYKLQSASITQSIYSTQYGIQCGAGGGADASGGFYGRGGRIIIHW
jgi:hypothetical protein